MTRKRICQPPHSLAYTRSSSRAQRNARANYRRWAASKNTGVQATTSRVRFVLAFSHATPSAKLGLNEVFINKIAMDDDTRPPQGRDSMHGNSCTAQGTVY